MKLNNIVFVTGNQSKAREAEEILGIKLEVHSVDLDEIQDLDLEKIALHKVNQAYEILKKPVIIDDVSVEVDVWNGFPGPLIKWLLKAGGNNSSVLLKMLNGEENRKATAKLAIGFHDGKKSHLFFGELRGRIGKEMIGDNGFGWDPVFIPDGYNQSFAQMSPDLKNTISHRKKALDKLSIFIQENYDI